MHVAYTRRCLLLQALPGFSSRNLARLLWHAGGVNALWESAPATWPALDLPPGTRQQFERLRDRDALPGAPLAVERQLDLLAAAGARALDVTASDYPPLLATIHDPPPVLYTRGDTSLLCRPQLGVVGARRASSAGLRAAGELSAAASRGGLVITSGLALGIDGAAHRGALDAGGASVGVMATGIEQVYPRRHRDLARELLREGCLVSEFPPGLGPRRDHFPRRNRVISGLSLGVLVVEAALPSGSLITAGTAIEQGREVFTLPWSIYHPGGRGCLRLLRDGAGLVQGVDDLWQELESLVTLQRQLSFSDAQADDQGAVAGGSPLLQLIGDGCVPVERLARDAGWPLARVLAELSRLELDGRVSPGAGGYRRR